MNIFVAKLSPITSGEDLQEIFKEFGRVVSAKVLIDHETGRSKCFGFVEMEDYNEGNKAIQALNGSELHGSIIIVKMARPREAGAEQERRAKPRIEIGTSNASGRFQPRNGRPGYHDRNGRGSQERHRPDYSKRDNRYSQRQKQQKPYIKEYTMMELMEEDD